MCAKPWAPSHVGTVASAYTELRISGAVKNQLVDLLVAKLDQVVPRMEQETLTLDAERKTLDDPTRIKPDSQCWTPRTLHWTPDVSNLIGYEQDPEF